MPAKAKYQYWKKHRPKSMFSCQIGATKKGSSVIQFFFKLHLYLYAPLNFLLFIAEIKKSTVYAHACKS